MANQKTYPRIYQFSLLTKAWRSLVALGLLAIGGVLIGTIQGHLRTDYFVDTVESVSFFVLAGAGIGFACTRQINGWIRLLVFLASCAPCLCFFEQFPPFPRDFAPGLAAGAMLFAFGLFYLLTTLNGRLFLHAEHLEYRFALKAHRVRYADILAGFKPEWSVSEMTLGLRLKAGKPLVISTFGRVDDALGEWLSSFPNEQQQADEREWDNWQSNPVFPRVYQNSLTRKIGLTVGALAVCAFGAVCAGVPEEALVKGDTWFAVGFIAPMAMVLVLLTEPRFGDALKVAWALGYLVLLPVLFFTTPAGAIQGMPAASIPFLRAFGGLCCLHGLFLLVANLRCRLILHEDSLEYRGFLTTRTVADADIVETFNPQSGSPFCISLLLKSGKVQRVINFGRFDPAFDQWVNSFPNREAEASDQERARMEDDSRLGGTPDKRMTAYRRDLKWLNWLNWPRVVLYGWAAVFPSPYAICMCIMLAVPIVVVLLIALQRWRWSMHTDDSVYPLGLGMSLAFGAAAALVLRGVLDHNMVDWLVTAAWSAGAALVLMLLVCWIEGRFPWKALAAGYVIYFCYAWGGLLFLNYWLDMQRPKVEPVIVTAFDNDSRFPTVTVRRADGQTIEYKGRLALNGKIGDTVCLYSGPGALGWGWYDGGECPVKTPDAVPSSAR